MSNLLQNKADVLINEINYDTVKMYIDSDGYFHMLFKQWGIDIKGAKYSATGDYALEDTNQGLCSKNCTYDGQLKVVDLEFAPTAPCNECDFELGITIQSRVDAIEPIINFFPATSKFYGDRLGYVTSKDGYVDDMWVLQVENTILNMLNKDQYRVVDGYRIYFITGIAETDDIAFNFVESNGTVTAVADVGEATIGATVISLQAVLDAIEEGYTVTAVGTTGLSIIGPANTVWSITDFDATDCALDSRKLRLVQKYEDQQFEVAFTENQATATVITEGIYPSLRGVDVARIFATLGHHGALKFASNVPTVDSTADYCKYSFKRLHHAYDDPAASRMNAYFQRVDVYVKQTEAETDYWTDSTSEDDAFGMDLDVANGEVADLDFNDAWTLLCLGYDEWNEK